MKYIRTSDHSGFQLTWHRLAAGEPAEGNHAQFRLTAAEVQLFKRMTREKIRTLPCIGYTLEIQGEWTK